jgi:hypothetical protein
VSELRPKMESQKSLLAGDVAEVPSDIVERFSDNEHINTDERRRYEWKSRWDDDAKKHIYVDALVVGLVLIITFIAIFLTWRGYTFTLLTDGCVGCSHATFNRYAYFFLGGLLGGTLFAVKYLYKVVARGYWHLDRRLWRIFTPLVAGGLGLAIGAMIDSGILGLTTKVSSGSAYFSVGFIAGYFADSALAKMQEVADIVFGSTDRGGHAPKTDQRAQGNKPA